MPVPGQSEQGGLSALKRSGSLKRKGSFKGKELSLCAGLGVSRSCAGEDAVHKKEEPSLQRRGSLKSSKRQMTDPTATASLPSVVLASVHQPTEEVTLCLSRVCVCGWCD